VVRVNHVETLHMTRHDIARIIVRSLANNGVMLNDRFLYLADAVSNR